MQRPTLIGLLVGCLLLGYLIGSYTCSSKKWRADLFRSDVDHEIQLERLEKTVDAKLEVLALAFNKTLSAQQQQLDQIVAHGQSLQATKLQRAGEGVVGGSHSVGQALISRSRPSRKRTAKKISFVDSFGNMFITNFGGKCLDDHLNPNIGLWDCIGTPPQTFLRMRNGVIGTINPFISRDFRCLKISAGENSLPVLQLVLCDRNSTLVPPPPTAVWAVRPIRDGWTQIYNPKTNLCLDAGTVPIKASPCDPADCNQLWYLATTAKAAKSILKSGVTPARPSPKAGKIFCWVLTIPSSHKDRVPAVANTWLQGCDYWTFVSSGPNDEYPTLVTDLPRPDSRAMIWEKTKQAWTYAYDEYLDLADWFFKADDDTFVHTENLRLFLENYNSSDPHYFGKRFISNRESLAPSDYFSGGAGYVISKEALRRLGDSFDDVLDTGEIEDVEFAKALAAVGVYPEDSRDAQGRERFHSFTLLEMQTMQRSKMPNFWLWNLSYYPVREGADCCSPSSISFHYVPVDLHYSYQRIVNMKCSLELSSVNSTKSTSPVIIREDPPIAQGRSGLWQPVQGPSSPMENVQNVVSEGEGDDDSEESKEEKTAEEDIA